jgi:hypothetical protein
VIELLTLTRFDDYGDLRPSPQPCRCKLYMGLTAFPHHDPPSLLCVVILVHMRVVCCTTKTFDFRHTTCAYLLLIDYDVTVIVPIQGGT